MRHEALHGDRIVRRFGECAVAGVHLEKS